MGFYLGFQQRGDVGSSGTGVAIVDGSKELVGLQNQFAAQSVLVIHQQHINTDFAEFSSRAQAGWTATDDQALHLDFFDFPKLRCLLDRKKFRKTLDRFNLHSGFDRLHARLHRQPIRHNHALGALAIRTENALWAFVLGVVSEDVYSVGEQGCGNTLALLRLQCLAFPEKLYCLSLRLLENGV